MCRNILAVYLLFEIYKYQSVYFVDTANKWCIWFMQWNYSCLILALVVVSNSVNILLQIFLGDELFRKNGQNKLIGKVLL